MPVSIIMSGPELRWLAEYYGELLEEGDTVRLTAFDSPRLVLATAVYADGSEGGPHDVEQCAETTR